MTIPRLSALFRGLTERGRGPKRRSNHKALPDYEGMTRIFRNVKIQNTETLRDQKRGQGTLWGLEKQSPNPLKQSGAFLRALTKSLLNPRRR